MGRQAAMRASNARDYFDFLGRNYPAVQAHLRQNLPTETLERIEKGVRTDWIPVEIDAPYVDMVHKFMGYEGMRRASREFMVQSLIRSPMMRGLFDGMMRVFGVEVGALLKILPSGFRQSYQDAFDLRVDRGENQAVVLFEEVAPAVLRAAYPVIWEGLFLGLYDLARVPPQLDFKVKTTLRRVEAHFRW